MIALVALILVGVLRRVTPVQCLYYDHYLQESVSVILVGISFSTTNFSIEVTNYQD
jgi:hypothetical protein